MAQPTGELRLANRARKQFEEDVREAIVKMTALVPLAYVLAGHTGYADATDEGLVRLAALKGTSRDSLSALLAAMTSSDVVVRGKAIRQCYRLVGEHTSDLSALCASHPTYSKLIRRALSEHCKKLATGKKPMALEAFLLNLQPELFFEPDHLAAALRSACTAGSPAEQADAKTRLARLTNHDVVGVFVREAMEKLGL